MDNFESQWLSEIDASLLKWVAESKVNDSIPLREMIDLLKKQRSTLVGMTEDRIEIDNQ